MTQLTLGYSDSEDRLWLIFTDDGSQLWLTRRMTLVLLQHLSERMTISCPGAAPDVSLKPEIRVALEFEAAHETEHDPIPQGQPQGGKPEGQPQGSVHVVSSITLKMGSSQVQLMTNAPGYQRTLCMSRAEAHRMLGALARRSQSAGWNMPNLPAWLQF
jgi:hypothetical protein